MSSAEDSKRGMGGMNMVTTVMAFSVSAFFVLFVFTRLLCARLHLSRAAAAADRAAADAFVVSVERGIHGLEPSVVTAFPTVKLGDGGPQQRPEVQEESQCTVCLEEYEAKDVVRVLPACGHAFHAPCIDAWLRHHPTCPVCRASLRAKTAANNNRATPLDYSVLVAGAGAAARSASPVSSEQVPASSSDTTASPQEAVADGRLEIITEEPGDRSPAAAAGGGSGGGSHSPCGETARQSGGSGAGASEHC
ncbi:unnamed protein product [Urochloa decumbens]|uniref:RING-type E3 ubiquitin transferase n=1 Tax=Urochloa decumbens TaxID=240449 RepID=A0ABC8VBS1_9POAL